MGVFKVAEIHELLGRVTKEEITFSRMVEIMNERAEQDQWNTVVQLKSSSQYTPRQQSLGSRYSVPVLVSTKSVMGESVMADKYDYSNHRWNMHEGQFTCDQKTYSVGYK